MRDFRRLLIVGLCVAAAYVAAARLGFLAAFVAEQVTTVWAPSGIALAALLLWGARLWPAVWLGAFVANAWTEAPLWTAAVIATGNTLEAVVAVWLLRRVQGFDPSLRRLADTARFIVFAAMVATVISATLGVTSLCLAGAQSWARFPGLWSAWWLGDALGALVVAPVLLTLARPAIHHSRQDWLGVAFLIGAAVLATEVVFGQVLGPLLIHGPLHYVIFPFAVIAAVRFGQPAVAMLVFSASAVGIWHTVRGNGPFASPDIYQGLILLQVFVGILASTGLLLAAVMAERHSSQRRRGAAHAVGEVLAEAPDLASAAPAILRAVCEHLEWPVGALWLIDDDRRLLRCLRVYSSGAPAVAEFARTTEETTFQPGTGLPGRVWAEGRAIWIEDVVHDRNFTRATAARAPGIHGAFGFPIRLDGAVLGVVEFFTHRVAAPDSELLDTMSTVGNHVGQFIGRKRGEIAVVDEQRQIRAIMETALDAIIGMDHHGVVTEFNPAAERLFGYQRETAMGHVLADLIIPPALREQHREGLARYLSTSEGPFLNRRIETRGYHADGFEFPIELAITRIADAGPPRFTGFVRDLTARVQAERERDELVQRELDARREGERRLTDVLEASNAALTLYEQDLELRYRWVFPQHPEFPHQNIGRSDTELLPSGEGERLSALKQAVLETGVGSREEITVTLPAETRSYDLMIEPRRNASGVIVGVSGVAVDITERKRGEQLLVEHKNVLELIATGRPAEECLSTVSEAVSRLSVHARACILVGDPARLTFAVRHGGTISASFAEGMLTPSVATVVAERVFRAEATVVPDVQQHAEWPAAWRELCLSHGIRACHFEPVLSADGGAVGSFALCLDDARAPSAWELRIAQFGAHIASIVIERERAEETLRASEERLKDADRRKDEFIAMLAHELRNPLAPIRTGLHLVRLAGDTPGAIERIRPMMERQVGHMVRLIDDLLDVSRITADKIHLQRAAASLADVVNGAVEANRAGIEAAGLQLAVHLPETPPLLFVDPTRLVQVISNLLNNATKFTDPGGQIIIRGQIVRTDSAHEELVLSVADTGIGIAGEMLPRVFELFTQGEHSARRPQPGLGIGLALARRIIEMHDGRIDARSDGPGRGSEFSIHLPVLNATRSVPDRLLSNVSSPAVARRVLVVDDNADAAETLASLVRTLGGEARTAADGSSGIQSASDFLPDVILLDIGMPGMDGYETCRRIRQERFGRRPFIVALTGWGQDDDKRRAADAGFDAHLTKPADPVVLARLLAESSEADEGTVGFT